MTTLHPVSLHSRSPLRLWSGRIAAIAAACLGAMHLVVNTIGVFVGEGGGILSYLAAVIAPTLVSWIIAVAAWRHADDRLSGSAAAAARVIMIIGTVVFLALLAQQIAFQGWRLLHPVGPGLWCVVGAPALVVAMIAARSDRRNRA